MNSIVQKQIELEENEKLMHVFGAHDEHLKQIEQDLDVTMIVRDNSLKIMGLPLNVEKAIRVIRLLTDVVDENDTVTRHNVLYALQMVEDNEDASPKESPIDSVCITPKGVAIKSKTFGQKKYIRAIQNNTITFCIGPAGTGKTFLAVALAVTAFREKKVDRIILTRPAVEAGEKLGFLPGDLQHKVDPYLRPLYDALYQLLGPEVFTRHQESGAIEVAPLAYMRGRTLDNSFIILDEAQNTTPQQMKMFLTRIGFGSKAIVNGDITQIDLDGNKSGLVEIIKILNGIRDISFIHLTEKDVVRHELIQTIIRAYDRYEAKNKKDVNI